jgi:hypothetical protein
MGLFLRFSRTPHPPSAPVPFVLRIAHKHPKYGVGGNLRLPRIGKQLTLGPGNVVFLAQQIAADSPATLITGFRIKSGTLTFSANISVMSGVVHIAPGETIQLDAELDPPAAHHGSGGRCNRGGGDSSGIGQDCVRSNRWAHRHAFRLQCRGLWHIRCFDSQSCRTTFRFCSSADSRAGHRNAGGVYDRFRSIGASGAQRVGADHGRCVVVASNGRGSPTRNESRRRHRGHPARQRTSGAVDRRRTAIDRAYKGTVEGFSIRSVKLRHHRGPVYTVPFSLLGAVQNQSRDWVIDKIAIGKDAKPRPAGVRRHDVQRLLCRGELHCGPR